MGRKPCCDKVGVKRGPWTIEEDHKLMNFIASNGILCWRSIPKLAGLLRCGKSCRLRWINYLRPDLKRGGFTEVEEDQIIQLHKTLGNRWSKIASHFEGRTDNEIKNHWNTKIKKRLKSMSSVPKLGELNQTQSQSSDQSVLSVEESSLDKGFKDSANIIVHHDEKEGIILDNEDDIFSNYEIFNGSLEVLEHWLNEESIVELDDQSSSASFQESLINTSTMSKLENHTGDSKFQQKDMEYMQEWVGDMDSIFWFNNNQVDQLLFTEQDQL